MCVCGAFKLLLLIKRYLVSNDVIKLIKSVTMFYGTKNILQKNLHIGSEKWGIFYKILLVP